MRFLSDRALERLRAGSDAPDLSGTHYRLLERVARGGMGVVYVAEDLRLGRRVALKVLDLPDASGEFANRLVREARVLARLEHPGIVPVHDVGTLTDGRVFYAMKFVEGRRLDEHIAAVPSLPDRLRVFLRICDAVAFSHARGVLHRDLKPANIMVGPFGEVLVMDWGLAKVLREGAAAEANRAASDDPAETIIELPQTKEQTGAVDVSGPTEHGVVLGTPGYMSPEQARGEVRRVDARSDIYALGALLKFLVTGKAPGEARGAAVSVPRPLTAVMAKAMAQEPGGRYSSVQELAGEVSRYLDGLAVTAYRESMFERVGVFTGVTGSLSC